MCPVVGTEGGDVEQLDHHVEENRNEDALVERRVVDDFDERDAEAACRVDAVQRAFVHIVLPAKIPAHTEHMAMPEVCKASRRAVEPHSATYNLIRLCAGWCFGHGLHDAVWFVLFCGELREGEREREKGGMETGEGMGWYQWGWDSQREKWDVCFFGNADAKKKVIEFFAGEKMVRCLHGKPLPKGRENATTSFADL